VTLHRALFPQNGVRRSGLRQRANLLECAGVEYADGPAQVLQDWGGILRALNLLAQQFQPERISLIFHRLLSLGVLDAEQSAKLLYLIRGVVLALLLGHDVSGEAGRKDISVH
jgi:hypothetical protein